MCCSRRMPPRPPAGAGFRRHAAAIRRWRHRRPAAARAVRRVGLLGSVRTVRSVRGTASVSAGAVSGVAGLGDRGAGLGARSRERRHRGVLEPRPASRRSARTGPDPRTAEMIINQWVPAAHRGDAIGDSARRVRDMLRRQGHEPDIYALTIDDDLRSKIRPFADHGATRGDITIFHFALPSPMTEAFRRLGGGARVLHKHYAGRILPITRRNSSVSPPSADRNGLARRARRSRPRRLGVQPSRTRGSGSAPTGAFC